MTLESNKTKIINHVLVQKKSQMIFKDFDLLDKDGEVDNAKIEPFIDAQMKNFTESSEKNAALMGKWTRVMKEASIKCHNMSTRVHTVSGGHDAKTIKSTEENIEPFVMLVCMNFYAIAVSSSTINFNQIIL